MQFLNAITKNLFLEGRLGTRICLDSIWHFSNTFLSPKIPSLKSWERSFDERFCKILQSCCRVLSRFVICLGASWFGNVMAFGSSLSKWGTKILVKNLLWQVRKFWFQRGFDCILRYYKAGYFLKGVQAIFWEIRKLHICSIINN